MMVVGINLLSVKDQNLILVKKNISIIVVMIKIVLEKK